MEAISQSWQQHAQSSIPAISVEDGPSATTRRKIEFNQDSIVSKPALTAITALLNKANNCSCADSATRPLCLLTSSFLSYQTQTRGPRKKTSPEGCEVASITL